MNVRFVSAATFVVLIGVWVASSSSIAPIADSAIPRTERPKRPAATLSEAPPARLTRDPFRYADEPAVRAEAPPPRRLPEPTAATPAPPAPERIRLSGFVRRGGELRAALWIAGTTLVAAVGESAEGYRVISIDEDAGVRVRTPAGEELLLRPAGTR
jgi:hypothetical protein